MSKQQEINTTTGEPMYVESLMTKEEWNERMRKFPKTSSNDWNSAHRPKPNSFKWRFGMGKTLSPEEIKNTISNLDYLLKKASDKNNS